MALQLKLANFTYLSCISHLLWGGPTEI